MGDSFHRSSLTVPILSVARPSARLADPWLCVPASRRVCHCREQGLHSQMHAGCQSVRPRGKSLDSSLIEGLQPPRGLEGMLLKERESHVGDTLVSTLTPTRGMLASRSGARMAHTSCNIPLKALTLDLRGDSTGFSEVETFEPAGQRKPQE